MLDMWQMPRAEEEEIVSHECEPLTEMVDLWQIPPAEEEDEEMVSHECDPLNEKPNPELHHTDSSYSVPSFDTASTADGEIVTRHHPHRSKHRVELTECERDAVALPDEPVGEVLYEE
jgi:hypothetical protein